MKNAKTIERTNTVINNINISLIIVICTFANYFYTVKLYKFYDVRLYKPNPKFVNHKIKVYMINVRLSLLHA